MIKDDIQASINMCIAIEIKNKIKLTDVINTLERAKKEHELLGLYQNLWALPYGDIGVVELLRQIEQLEKELRELK